MKKIPGVFQRDRNGDPSRVLNVVNDGQEWVLAGEGLATRKWDGTACLVKEGKVYKRYDAKVSKETGQPLRPYPPDFSPCGFPDLVTGHHPGWVPIGNGNEDRWHREAPVPVEDGTYELCGPKIGGNAEGLENHNYIRHGALTLWVTDRSFAGLHDYLERHAIEGIVFHHPDGRMAKVTRRDFGFPWPINNPRNK